MCPIYISTGLGLTSAKLNIQSGVANPGQESSSVSGEYTSPMYTPIENGPPTLTSNSRLV